MKKFKSYNHLLLTLSTFLCGSILTFASTIPVHISGAPIVPAADVSTYISDNDRVMLPFRAVSESLNIAIEWESPYVVVNGTHVLTGEPVHIKIKANENKLLLNGTPYLSDQAIEIVDGHSYIPIRLFSELLGYDVAWTNQSVYITLPTPIMTKETITPSLETNTPSSYSGGGSSSQTDDENNHSDQPSDDNNNNDSDLPSDDNNNNNSDLPSDDNNNTDSDQPSDDNNNTDLDQPSDDNNNNNSDLPSDDNN
ncbi:MAG: copper amine oxidase N-terminal domain-containing protein, partial [Cellulosilyticaceae bacterium]